MDGWGESMVYSPYFTTTTTGKGKWQCRLRSRPRPLDWYDVVVELSSYIEQPKRVYTKRGKRNKLHEEYSAFRDFSACLAWLSAGIAFARSIALVAPVRANAGFPFSLSFPLVCVSKVTRAETAAAAAVGFSVSIVELFLKATGAGQVRSWGIPLPSP